MLDSGKTKPVPTIDEAVSVKPDNLGVIEIELRENPPRSAQWCRPDAILCSNDYFRNWEAVRGWIVSVEEISPGYEGPDYHIWYAFEMEGRIVLSFTTVGYDTYHWALSQQEYFNWFKEKIVTGKAITVLVNPTNSDESMIYGILEPYIYDNSEENLSKHCMWAAK